MASATVQSSEILANALGCLVREVRLTTTVETTYYCLFGVNLQAEQWGGLISRKRGPLLEIGLG